MRGSRIGRLAGVDRTRMPIASTGNRRSANTIRRHPELPEGWRVTSAARSGDFAICKIPCFARIAR